MEKIDLRTAKKGDRFETRDGRVATYVGALESRKYPHAVRFANGMEGTRTNKGESFKNRGPHSGDLIRKLPDEAPETAPPPDAAHDDLHAALAAAIAQHTGQPLSVATAKAVAAHMADALGYEPFVGGEA